MKSLPLGLQTNVVSIYDKTKTYVAGRVVQKTINAKQVLGPPLTRFIDVQTQAVITPFMEYFNPLTNRKFVVSVPSAGVGVIALYTFNVNTGDSVYVGKIQFNYPALAATNFTMRSFSVNDNGATWDICFGYGGSVAENGGLLLVHGLVLADFIPVGFPTIGFATGSNQKAVYFLQDPSSVGTNNAMTTCLGSDQPWQAASGSINTKVYFLNGTFLLPQFYVFDLAGTPTVDKITTGITITSATPGVVSWPAHGFVTGDQITFTAGTLPTGLSLNTVYFVSNTGNTTNTFQVSTTKATALAGTSIATTGAAGSGITGMRAFGISTNLFSFKTGIMPAMAGTGLSTNSFSWCLPGANVPTLNGFDCIALASNTTLYLGKLSEITSGVTTWPSLSSANALGTGTDVTIPTPILARYSSTVDQWVFVTNTAIFIMKKHVNNQITSVFGGVGNIYMELNNFASVPATYVLVSSITIHGGWLSIMGSTVGQRGLTIMDLRSDSTFEYSYFTSPIVATSGYSLKALTTIEQLFNFTNTMKYQYKTAATSSDTIFNDPTSGWTTLPNNEDLTAYALSNFTQVRVLYNVLSALSSSPSQLEEMFMLVNSINEISDKWKGSVDNTSQNGASPAYTAFRQVASDSGTKYFRAYDDSGVLVASANTSADFAFFDKSTNNGTSWTPMTGANDYSSTALTTEIRYKWASPPGVRVTCSLRDS